MTPREAFTAAQHLPLYLVLDPTLCGGSLGMIETTRAAIAGGITIVQLRAPQWKKREMAECARALLSVTRPAGIPLIIDDHADVALAVDAEGLHVGQKDLSPEDARIVIGNDRILGLSINTVEEARQIPKDLVDYIGIGPYRATATKKDAGAALGRAELANIVQYAQMPSVAIGGIKLEHVTDVLAAGVDGIAVVSAICGTPSPEAATRALREAVDAARAAKPVLHAQKTPKA